jgi:chromosome segregation protein
MLKRLELVGFKSFADKTEFDFPSGITGIVGPNGSGKSNVVDAVRWVLGEQSAKSLRGGEMADVIFNGSATRRSLGLAEVSMTFDNARRSLATDAEEVQITRRVYRGGEGEYLINGQVCRLKDIKDLFLGSGAGNDAYSIIEQGRVDVLLQASTKDRRTIFEEAAGISRFKARKIETLRKLEKVDQNLQRLKDIIEEVEKQLRSVKLQAAKAQRHQEYSGRLKELRVALGYQEYRQLSERLGAETERLDEQRAALRADAEQAELWERELRQMEEALARLDAAVGEQEGNLAAARQQIAAEETTWGHEWELSDDLETELSQTRLRLAELNQHLATLAESFVLAGVELREAEGQCATQRDAVAGLERELAASDERLAVLHGQVGQDKAEHLESMRQAARLQNDAVSYKAQVENLTRERGRLQARSEQAAEHLASLGVELAQLTAADEALQARLTIARQAAAEIKQEKDRFRQLSEETTRLASELRAQKSGLASRVDVLEGLERSHEGFGTGAREVFALLGQAEPGPWRTVIGILADVLHVRREFAPLIDVALGERAQRFLIRDTEMLAQALHQHGTAFSGRVSFLPVRQGKSATPNTQADYAALPGVVAVASQVVRSDDPQLADLPEQLLGTTLVVGDLAAARQIAAANPGLRFVTLQGELLEADGTLTVGAHHGETGILSRKSELRELRERAVDLDRRLAEIDRDLSDLRERLVQCDRSGENQQTEIDVLAEQATDSRSRLGQHRQRREGLHEEVHVGRTEMSELEREIEKLEAAWRQARQEASAAEVRVEELQARLAEAEHEIRERESDRQRQLQAALAAKVGLAQVEERLSALRARHAQLETHRGQREYELRQSEGHLAATRERLAESEATLLHTSSTLAHAFLRKEAAERQLAERAAERNQLRHDRQQRVEQSQSNRNAWRVRQEEAHARELAVNDLRHRSDTLCGRLREDYQLELAALTPEDVAALPPVEDAAAADEEVAELRRKLGRLGSVNLEALQELSDLEARASALQIQYDDLTSAQRALHDIITKINTDSRRLFTATFQTIRTHFQELFRKLFGGGMADVVLEDESDVLESGIEIIARPPGKELRSISLMSGGEKTLTAVALLLAIFRSKPSPFCILDEVDAALDEANIDRFTSVLREFLDQSQFILITHSKRTMACADVLYGVTMQESGVSRRFAVRFEDWPDEESNADEPAA